MANDAIYAINEGLLPLDVPGTWEDQTIHVLRIPGDGRATASLIITRETLPMGMEINDFVQAELDRLRTTLPEFELHGRVPLTWSDVTGEALLTRWRSAEGLMDQVLTCRRAYGRRLLIFTATHPAPFPTPAYEAVMASIAGFKPREQSTPEPIRGRG
ncbi:DUF1795 domain-containing protein [Jiella sp. MQZ9-1]|uniref:DUF1795 domain-containing protein n=1 Tax=Jiella flava TaxID=2816857 RepID=A0A939G2X6_9HYPH|nr:DcrB-related protein [Jiella flava]MBO0664573.1 DUF1795 domain-containing protein [Jiella flava]MCD2472824.1 DUF1795 domain-containing protein [Jiella flava]